MAGGRGLGVSIPFIAGQWSLLLPALDPERAQRLDSIPFIAGQWSLRARADDLRKGLAAFQSPSLRGSGRFRGRGLVDALHDIDGSDHCPAMKGIETRASRPGAPLPAGSDHCPAMKGIETSFVHRVPESRLNEATTAPQ